MRTAVRLQAQDHMFALVDGPEFHLETADWSTGLIAPLSAGAVIHTGVLRGAVTVTVLPVQHEPAIMESGQWDEIAEVSVNAPEGNLEVHQLQYGPFDPRPELPTLSLGGPGHYRVRVYARGRDVHYDQIQEDSEEKYVIESWPAEPLPGLIIRATDRCGYSLRLSGLGRPRIATHDEHAIERAERQQREASRIAINDLAGRLRSAGDNHP